VHGGVDRPHDLARAVRHGRRSNCGRCTVYRRLSPLNDRAFKEQETTMPELLVDFITSLDGYGAADGRPTVLSGPPSTDTGGEQ